MSLRTKEGQEQSVLDRITTNGGFSIFWATENQKRAYAIERLVKSRKIVREGGIYPWCAYRLGE